MAQRQEKGCLPCCNCCVTVPQDKYYAVEKFGKFDDILRPGLAFAGADCCGVCISFRSITSRVEQNIVTVSTKTKDNVFVTAKVAVQQSVVPEKVQEAMYKLTDVHQQIDSYVSDVVRSQVPTMLLDEAFEKKDDISNAIQDKLTHEMSAFGFAIHKSLVTELTPNAEVMHSMNEINKQKRLRDASIMAAEAEKIKVVKAAEASADAAQLQGEGIARQRRAIIDGLRDSITHGTEETLSTEKVSELLLITQYFETLRAMGLDEGGPCLEQEDLGLFPGDLCETLTLVTLRKGESVLSDVIVELPQGLCLELVELGTLGSPRLRVRVRAGRLLGWITARTSQGQAHVRRRPAKETFSPQDVEVDARYQVKAPLPLRETECLDSPLLGDVLEGSVVRVLEVRDDMRRRAKVQGEGLEGWVTLATHMGQMLLGRLSKSMNRHHASFSTAGSKAKELLELAKAGNVDELKRLVKEGEAAPGALACSDVRGRTLLMYAAHAGSCEIVQFILSHPDVRVNELDDAQKSALHYAAGRATDGEGEARRAELVRLLLAQGASVEGRDRCGCTPLMLAAAAGCGGAAGALLEARASANAKDFEGRSALAYARSLGREGLARQLLEAGAEELEEDPDDEMSRTESQCFPVSGQRRSMGLRQSVLVRQSVRGRLSLAPRMAARRSTVSSMAAQMGSRRATRMSVFWTAGLAAGGDMGAKVIAIEGPLGPQGESEEALAKERALARLEAMVAEGEVAAPAELEGAIMEAEAAGADSEELEEARKRVDFLRERALAHDALLAAIAERSAPALREAIQRAEERSVPVAEVDRARALLAVEEPKEKAWEKLASAQDKGDTASLREALAEAAKAGVRQDDLLPFEDLLRGAESKDQAEAALEEAIEDKDVVALRFALQQARSVSAIPELIARGEAVLQEEEPRYEARKALEELQEGASISEMRTLLERAMQVGLEACEYGDLEELLRLEEQKEQALAEVSQALAELEHVSSSSAAELAAARDKLAAVVHAAQEAGASEADVRRANVRRRKLHNAIQDLKGAVRVFCRVRPLNSREKNLNDEKIVTAGQDGLSLRVEEKRGEPIDFSFDAVFTPGTQGEVFEECRDLVQSALDGYNVTIFAYGQTGAGKTFTMYGAPGNEGTSPRTIQELFRLVEQGKDRFAYTVLGSMMELYRNELVDLLVLKPRGSTVSKAGSPHKLNVHMSRSGSVVIDNVTEEECASAEQLSNLLERGNAQRTVAATAMNSESSRSHLIVAIQIVSVNRETGEQVSGKILMCDLAGSERLKKSEVTGDMQKEAIEINKSLTALGDVIECLTKGKPHVPYRNHTLTQVMQDSLGGSSKTLMFVNCSPAFSNADETIMALKYATRAKKISNEAKRSMMKPGGLKG